MRLLLLLIALLTVASCAARPPESAPEVTRTTDPTRSRPPTLSLPPPVPRSLDASAYRNRICEILTNEQANSFGFPGLPDQSEAPDYISCIRASKDPEIEVALLYSTPALFKKVNGGPMASLEQADLTTISGQPALVQGTPNLSNVVRYCTIVLGLSNEQAMQIDVQDPQGSGGACERATKVAEAIVRNLGG